MKGERERERGVLPDSLNKHRVILRRLNIIQPTSGRRARRVYARLVRGWEKETKRRVREEWFVPAQSRRREAQPPLATRSRGRRGTRGSAGCWLEEVAFGWQSVGQGAEPHSTRLPTLEASSSRIYCFLWTLASPFTNANASVSSGIREGATCPVHGMRLEESFVYFSLSSSVSLSRFGTSVEVKERQLTRS